MKLATLSNGGRDGVLVVVSRDLNTAALATDIAPTLLTAIERWPQVAIALHQRYEQLNAGRIEHTMAFDAKLCHAPLPRAPQWLDGSAFLNHGRLLEKAFGNPPIADLDTIPLMYQGASDDFLGPCDDVALPTEASGIDFEGEFGVIVGDVPMGCSATEAGARIRLIVLINDWSLRVEGKREIATGFGFVHAKPSTSFAPVAITPDELDDAWAGSRVHRPLNVEWRGHEFGRPNGNEMNFGFDQLIAHAAKTRKLSAGTVIGSGTVSNAARETGSACIQERRVIEMIDHGKPLTPFMRFGERVSMSTSHADGSSLFGSINQRVIQASGQTR
jgi:fumarylacetoacetate (FAA) hydrolase